MSDRFSTIPINADPKPKKKRPDGTRPGRRPITRKSAPGPKRPRPWLIPVLSIPAVLLALYTAVGFFLAPSWLTGYLLNSLQQTADLGLTAGKARFNPFTLRLQLRDIVSTSADSTQSTAPAAPLLQVDHLLVDLSPTTLLRNGLVSKRLEIQGLRLALIRHQDNSYNLPALAAAERSGGQKDPARLSRPPLLFSLNNISIRDSSILFDDRVAGRKHSVEQLKLDLPTLSNFSFEAPDYIRPHFSAMINGSPVELSGEAALPGEGGRNGLNTNLSCNVQDLELPLYFAYLPKSVPLLLNKGKGNGQIRIAFVPAVKKGGLLTLGFALTTTELELTNTEQTLAMTVPTLEIEGSLQPLDGTLRIQNLRARQPRFSAEQAHFSRDMARLFSSPATSPEPARQSQPHFEIDSLTIENGTLQLLKQNPANPEQPPWNDIQLTATHFRLSPEQAADKGTFALSAKQEKTSAALDWQGSFNNRGIPEGILQLSNIGADTLLSFIDPAQAKATSGSANLRGRFSFNPTAHHPGMSILDDATTEIRDLVLLSENKSWLSAGTMRTKGTKFKKDSLDLGTIEIKEGTLTLPQGRVPPLLQGLGSSKNPVLVQGLDFSGKAILHAPKDKAKPLQLDELQIKAGKLSTTDSKNNFDLTARINQTGTLKAQGLTTLAPLKAQLSLVFSAIDSEQIAPWLPDAPLFQQSRAIVHGQGTYRYPDPGFTGSLQLDSALIRADEKDTGLAVSKARINDITIKTRPLGIAINELILESPRLTWLQDAGSPGPFEQIGSFLQSLMASSRNIENPPNDDARSSLPVIQKISFDNGTISYTDQRLNSPWSSEISQLMGRINTVPEKSAAATSLEISGQISSAPFTLSGSADLLSAKGDFTTDFDLKGFPLQLLAAQIGPLLDLNTDSGSLDLILKLNRRNGVEQGEAAFLFSALRPGAARTDTALALALLTDSRDQIAMLVPIAPDTTEPLVKQTAATFQAMTAQAAVVPFLLAGAEFANLQDNQFISFPAGLSELDVIGDSGVQNTLQHFAALLAARPRLGLVLTGMADPIHDRAVILKGLEEKERKRVALKNEQRLEEWREEQKIKKQKQQAQQAAAPQGQGMIIEQDIPIQEAPPLPLSPDPITVSDTTLYDLAQERALEVYDFFATLPGISSARITIEEQGRLGEAGTPGNQVLVGLQHVEQPKP